jgi:hypothetical protein
MAKNQRVLAAGLFFILVIAVIGMVYVFSASNVTKGQIPSQKTSISSSTGSSGTVFATLFIKNQDDTSYWVNAPQSFNVASIYGSPSGSGSDFTEISSMQNNIYMNINPSDTVSSWTFSCQETILLADTSGNTVATIAGAKTVNANGQTLPSEQNVWVTGATVTDQELQTILNQPHGNYYFVIELANINLSLTINGAAQTLSSNAQTSNSNTLSWLIQVK